MQAVQIKDYGGTDQVQLVSNAPKPPVGDGQVLVEAHAASLNPFDLTVLSGGARHMAELKFPATLGGDFAGLADREAVYGQASPLSGHGAFAELVPVKRSQLAAKPKSLNFTQAAALPLVGCSAYQALVDHINLQPGQKILIHGGAGGIGSVAIQLAKHFGAYVATTVRAADADFAKSLGANEVIDYQSQDFSQLLSDYDAVFDTVGGETNAKSYEILKDGAAFVSMVDQPDEEKVKQKNLSYTAQFTHVTTDRLTKIAELVDKGILKVQVDKVFPLDQTAEALEYLKTGHPRGKVVIQIKQ